MEDKARKQKEMEEYFFSSVLYDWSFSQFKVPKGSPSRKCEFLVVPKGTQNVVEFLHNKYPTKKLVWLNLANAHNTCGTYNVAYGGSQEEEVATNCNGAAILGIHAETCTNSVRVKLSKENHIVYRPRRHIPPGGNYFAKTKFITSDPQVDCYMIAAAFADFRPYIPFFNEYSERTYYFELFGYGALRNMKEIEDRLKVDMEGVVKTALKNEMDILVLGASGCGAFLHCPWKEAQLWRQVLDKYKNNFDIVAFAILPDPHSPSNVDAFRIAFSKQPVFEELARRKCHYTKTDFAKPLLLGIIFCVILFTSFLWNFDSLFKNNNEFY